MRYVGMIYVTCTNPDCEWVQMGWPVDHCIKQVEDFNNYYETLDPESQAHHGGPSDLEKDYGHCHNCGRPSKRGQFRRATSEEVTTGLIHTFKSIMLHDFDEIANAKN
tara:strand:+ start:70 stop:393 length:324 start_codon:yes stop_codon:yes gene_type:complete